MVCTTRDAGAYNVKTAVISETEGNSTVPFRVHFFNGVTGVRSGQQEVIAVASPHPVLDHSSSRDRLHLSRKLRSQSDLTRTGSFTCSEFFPVCVPLSQRRPNNCRDM